MTTLTAVSRRRSFGLTVAAAAIVTIAGCGGSDEPAADALATEETSPTVSHPATDESTSATTSVAPSVAPTTQAAVVETTAPSTAVATTAASSTTEPCQSSCPLTDEQQDAVDTFFQAYNGDDWDAFLATIGTDTPEWEVQPEQVQNTELMRYDFIWAASMHQTATPERCIDQFGVLSCSVVFEDDLHRALAPYGFEPSRCEMALGFDGLVATPKRFPVLYCFNMYDTAMHLYGSWFDETYPELDPIQGVHYRAWNQTDETAGARAAAHLDQWIAEVVRPYVDDGGDIFSVGH